MPDPIVFKDMAEREEAERKRLQARLYELNSAALQNRQLHPELVKERDEIDAKLKFPSVLDPLFKAVQGSLDQLKLTVLDHVDGKLPSQQASAPQPLSDQEMILAAVYGILIRDGHTDPAMQVKIKITRGAQPVDPPIQSSRGLRAVTSAEPDPRRLDQYRDFSKALADAAGEFNANKDLYLAVFPIIRQEDDKTGRDVVLTNQLAAVVKRLIEQGIGKDDTSFRRHVLIALDGTIGGADGPPSNIIIDLPDLEESADIEIVAENLHAMQAIYFGMMLEDLKFFQVVDKLVELFQYGMLPFGRGGAGDILYEFWRESSRRMTEGERKNHYARAFGYPGGDAMMGNPNREFNDLWLRFVSAVSSYIRQYKVEDLLRAGIPAPVSQEQVRKAGRDLAANLSLHGYGMSYHVATELQKDIKRFIDLLSDKDVKNAYGARDLWQVIDQVATLELGGSRGTMRYRTMATSGAVIIRWLADRRTQLTGSAFTDLINLNNVRFPPPRPSGEKPWTIPNDADLVTACEQWLAVTGTQDARVEEYAQPNETPNMTSRPIQIPSIARDLLDSVGVQAGQFGVPRNGYVNGR